MSDDEKTAEEMFGAVVPGEAVRDGYLDAMDRREEAAEAAPRCEGCGHIWSAGVGPGSHTRTMRIGGKWWHFRCYLRAQ